MIMLCAGSKNGQYEDGILFRLVHCNTHTHTLNLYTVQGNGLKLIFLYWLVHTLGSFIIIIKSLPATKTSLGMSN